MEVDFDSDGDSASPDDRQWTELTVERRRPPLERVDIDPISETPLVLKVTASSAALARLAAEFLKEQTGGQLIESD
jgi:hypothetical protein